jgi:hypothetical protein
MKSAYINHVCGGFTNEVVWITFTTGEVTCTTGEVTCVIGG